MHGLTVVLGTARGVGPGQVPTLMRLFVAYYVQCTVRYRLNEWAANADERATQMDIDLAQGCVHLEANLMTPAPALGVPLNHPFFWVGFP